MQTLVVVPTYNEAENITDVLCRTRAALPDAAVLVVDDNSPDGTANVVRSAAPDVGGLHLLSRDEKGGLGAAYRAGFAWGIERGFEILCQMDADLSHDPAALPSLVGPVASNRADMAIGSRYVPGGRVSNWPRSRRWLSRCGNRYASLVLGVAVRDLTSGFRACRADVLNAVGYDASRSRGYAFLIETAYRVWRWDGRILEIPITFTDRVRGRSKMSVGVAAEQLWLVTRLGGRNLRRGRRHGAAGGDRADPSAAPPCGQPTVDPRC
jgi:dolichol-phosphate mannosyltransferase